MANVIDTYLNDSGAMVIIYDDGHRTVVPAVILLDSLAAQENGGVGGAGGGGASTVADGADVAEGHKADAAASGTQSGSTTPTVIGLLKGIMNTLLAGITAVVSGTVTANAGTNLNTSALATESGGHLAAVDAAQGATTDLSSASTVIGILKAIKAAVTGTLAVSGTFWQATQPVSGTFWQAKQPVSMADGDNAAQGATTDLSSASTVIGLLKAIKAAVQGTIAVSGTFWQATQPVSGTFWQAIQPTSSADGGFVTVGAKADAQASGAQSTGTTPTVIGLLKGIMNTLLTQLVFGYQDSGSALPTVVAAPANSTDSSVNIAVTSTVLLAARAKRIRAVFKNTDATNPVFINFANGTATTANFPLKAGESIEMRGTGATKAISTGGTVAVSVLEEYHA